MAATSPFYIVPQHAPQLATTAGGAGGPALAASGGLPATSGFPDPAYYAFLTTGSSGGSGGVQPAGSSYVMSLQDQQALSSGQLPSIGGQHVTYVEVGSAGGLPIMVPQQYAQPQLSAGLGQPQPSQQMSQQFSQGAAASGGQPAAAGAGAAAASKPRQRSKRPYKPPTVVAAERKQKNEANVRACSRPCSADPPALRAAGQQRLQTRCARYAADPRLWPPTWTLLPTGSHPAPGAAAWQGA